MEYKTISSRDNSLIKLVSALQNFPKARKENNLFVLEGLRICLDAYDNGIQFDKLIVTNNSLKKFGKEIKKFENISNESYILTDNLFKKISDTTSPQGIIALAKIPVINQTINKDGRYIALENINDPSNLGAISRTAEALGVSGIIISSGSCDPYSPKSLRASMGTLLRMPIIVTNNLIEFFKANNLKSYACVVDKNAKKINDFKFSDGCVLIIGNEANGITEGTKHSADLCITIPMSGNAESLNVAIAAAISMWEMTKE